MYSKNQDFLMWKSFQFYAVLQNPGLWYVAGCNHVTSHLYTCSNADGATAGADSNFIEQAGAKQSQDQPPVPVTPKQPHPPPVSPPITPQQSHTPPVTPHQPHPPPVFSPITPQQSHVPVTPQQPHPLPSLHPSLRSSPMLLLSLHSTSMFLLSLHSSPTPLPSLHSSPVFPPLHRHSLLYRVPSVGKQTYPSSHLIGSHLIGSHKQTPHLNISEYDPGHNEPSTSSYQPEYSYDASSPYYESDITHFLDLTVDDSDYGSRGSGYGSREDTSSAGEPVTFLSPESESPPLFDTPPKLKPIERVMQYFKSNDTATLRLLTVALARDCIFGRDELMKSSMGGRHGYDALDPEKLEYIKALTRSLVPNKPKVELECIWGLCRISLGKSCQGLRTSAKKKQIKS